MPSRAWLSNFGALFGASLSAYRHQPGISAAPAAVVTSKSAASAALGVPGFIILRFPVSPTRNVARNVVRMMAGFGFDAIIGIWVKWRLQRHGSRGSQNFF